MKQPPSTLSQDNWTLGTGLVKKGSDNEPVASPLSGTAPFRVNAGQVTRETCMLQHPEAKHFKESNYPTLHGENKLSYDSPLTEVRFANRNKRKEPLVALNDQERQKEARRLEHNTKIVKMLLSVVFSYALCLLPNQVAWLWSEFGDGRNWPGGEDSYMKQTGMLVVSLRCVNFGFWSRLRCSGQSANILSRQGLV